MISVEFLITSLIVLPLLLPGWARIWRFRKNREYKGDGLLYGESINAASTT